MPSLSIPESWAPFGHAAKSVIGKLLEMKDIEHFAEREGVYQDFFGSDAFGAKSAIPKRSPEY